MPVIQKVKCTEACPFEHPRFLDTSMSTFAIGCEHEHCEDNENQLCEAEENVWCRVR